MMIFFLFLIETIFCGPSSELSLQYNSDDGSQHMFLCRINEKSSLIITKYSLLSRTLNDGGFFQFAVSESFCINF